jgi:hypothetical protein
MKSARRTFAPNLGQKFAWRASRNGFPEHETFRTSGKLAGQNETPALTAAANSKPNPPQHRWLRMTRRHLAFGKPTSRPHG